MTEVWETGSGRVAVKVNGETVGNAGPEEILSSVVNRYSTNHGLKTFNVLVNGSKVDTASGSRTLGALSATTVELLAKDARGNS